MEAAKEHLWVFLAAAAAAAAVGATLPHLLVAAWKLSRAFYDHHNVAAWGFRPEDLLDMQYCSFAHLCGY